MWSELKRYKRTRLIFAAILASAFAAGGDILLMHRRTSFAVAFGAAFCDEMRCTARRDRRNRHMYRHSAHRVSHSGAAVSLFVPIRLYRLFAAGIRRGCRGIFVLHGCCLCGDRLTRYPVSAARAVVHTPRGGGRQGRRALRISRHHSTASRSRERAVLFTMPEVRRCTYVLCSAALSMFLLGLARIVLTLMLGT